MGKHTKTQKNKTETADFNKQFATFFKKNKYSKIEKRGKYWYITNPWNDASVSFVLRPESIPSLKAALNKLILPPRFTGIYHLDSNTMEYIWTLLDNDDPYFLRQFEFNLDGKSYHCKFDQASARLVNLARWFRRTGKTTITEHRNLLLLREYIEYIDEKSKKRPSSEEAFTEIRPASFYVSGFEGFDDGKILEVSKHINFFMYYYDRETPHIVTHPVEAEPLEKPRQLQFIQTAFPKKISSRSHDPFLLDLSLAAASVPSRLRFLYYYQILEYAAFYHVDERVKRDLLNIINVPDIHSDPEKYIARILETVSDIRSEDEAKINMICRNACDINILWKELQHNLSYFTKRQEFDGGFALEPFISEDTTLESFRAMWYPKTPDTLRSIRNALVHGRERRVSRVINPTLHNDLLIKPWLTIIQRMAEHIIIFCSGT
jgi:hypothetical protein